MFRERSRELRRGSIGEAAARPSDIVVDAPRLNRLLRIGQAHEPVLVQTLVPHPPVKAFGVRILNRLARLNEAWWTKYTKQRSCEGPATAGASSPVHDPM